MSYTNIHINTSYTFLESNIRIDDLVDFCVTNKIPTVSITDKNNLFASYELFKKAKKNNLKPLIGMEVVLQFPAGYCNVVLFAKNDSGLQNLFVIASAFDETRLSIKYEWVIKYSKNLICVIKNNYEIFETYEKDFKEAFEDDLYVGNDGNNSKHVSKIKSVAFNNVNHLCKQDKEIKRILSAIKNAQKLDQVPTDKIANHMLSDAEAKSIFSKEEINHIDEIINKCNVKFEHTEKKLLGYPTPNNIDSKVYLEALCKEGLKRRFKSNQVSSKYIERIKYELQVIEKMGFCDYFLIVWDYVLYATNHGIVVGPGRGSAAGSLVSYVLNITNIDPIANGLIFERFLNPERVTMPDIDIDFQDDRREEIIEYIFNKYGNEHVAHIVTFQTIQVKMAFRDLGRIFDIPLTEIDKISKSFDREMTFNLQAAVENSEFLKVKKQQYPDLFYWVEKIIDIPRQVGMHAAGVVFSKTKLSETIPIIKLNNNLSITQYSMDFLEELGLLKMDLLGLRNLTIIHNILNLIKENKNIEVDLDKIPIDDAKTFKLLANGDTGGIFQLESEGMKKILRQMKPDKLEDIVATSSLFRPGPQENIPLFIERKNGKKKIDYIDPVLENILSKTYGIIVYQEQIMEVAKVYASFTFAKADILRRAISKKDFKYLDELRNEFINNSVKNGHSLEKANEVYELILKFGNYGFNRSHALAYSVVGYQMAYLKSNFPLEFMTSLISSVLGSETKTYEYLNEARKYGVKILPPSISKSSWDFIIEDNAIRYSLMAIKGIGTAAYRSFISERNKAPFNNIFEAIIRLHNAGINEKMLLNLIAAGAFDEYKYTRTTVEKNLSLILEYGQLISTKKNKEVFFNFEMVSPPKLKEYEDDQIENAKKEFEVLSLYLKNHPIKSIKDSLNEKDIDDVATLLSTDKLIFKIVVSINSKRIIKTKTGKLMCFIKVGDETAAVDLVVFTTVYEKYKDILETNTFYKMTVKKQDANSYILLSLEKING